MIFTTAIFRPLPSLNLLYNTCDGVGTIRIDTLFEQLSSKNGGGRSIILPGPNSMMEEM